MGEKKLKILYWLLNYNKNKPLHIMLPETSPYIKRYHGQAKLMYFLIEDHGLLEKCNIICDKFSTDLKKEFVSKLVHNKNFLKTKVKPHGDEVTVCYHKKTPNEDSNHTYLSVIGLEFTRKKDEIFICKCF